MPLFFNLQDVLNKNLSGDSNTTHSYYTFLHHFVHDPRMLYTFQFYVVVNCQGLYSYSAVGYHSLLYTIWKLGVCSIQILYDHRLGVPIFIATVARQITFHSNQHQWWSIVVHDLLPCFDQNFLYFFSCRTWIVRTRFILQRRFCGWIQGWFHRWCWGAEEEESVPPLLCCIFLSLQVERENMVVRCKSAPLSLVHAFI